MKIKFFLFALLILSLNVPGFGQSVFITSNKINYIRPKAESPSKKRFTVARPQVKKIDDGLARKIENTISYEKNFEFNLKEEINEIQWLEEADFKVNYNKKGLLGVTLSISGSGAYPSESNKPVIVDLKTGEKIRAENVFANLSELALKGKERQKIEVDKAVLEIKKENPDEENPASLFENSDFTVKDLDTFSITDRGVIFWYNYDFPHVIQALQPEGRYFFTWSQLKPFVKRDGVFAQFIR